MNYLTQFFGTLSGHYLPNRELGDKLLVSATEYRDTVLPVIHLAKFVFRSDDDMDTNFLGFCPSLDEDDIFIRSFGINCKCTTKVKLRWSRIAV